MGLHDINLTLLYNISRNYISIFTFTYISKVSEPILKDKNKTPHFSQNVKQLCKQ